jgi:hypothetical protein
MALKLLKRNWKVYATSIEASSMSDLQKSGCEASLIHFLLNSRLSKHHTGLIS